MRVTVNVMERIDQYICDTQGIGIDEISSQKSLVLERSLAAWLKLKVE
jgi:hypothetical protein